MATSSHTHCGRYTVTFGDVARPAPGSVAETAQHFLVARRREDRCFAGCSAELQSLLWRPCIVSTGHRCKWRAHGRWVRAHVVCVPCVHMHVEDRKPLLRVCSGERNKKQRRDCADIDRQRQRLGARDGSVVRTACTRYQAIDRRCSARMPMSRHSPAARLPPAWRGGRHKSLLPPPHLTQRPQLLQQLLHLQLELTDALLV